MDWNGFVLFEGVVVLCLEECEGVIVCGVNIFGEIKGYGNYFDVFDFIVLVEDKVVWVKII